VSTILDTGKKQPTV